MPAKAKALGPGKLTIGATGSLKDWSCQVSELSITFEKEEESIKVLCGDSVSSSTYSATLEGTVVQDWHESTGFVKWSWDNKGETLPFVFIPDLAGKAQVKGHIIIDPINIGGEMMKKNTSDIKWQLAGEPTLTYDYSG